METKRTEDEIVARAGITVILGGKEYSIPPLVIRDSREWRKKAIKLIAPLPQLVKVKLDETDAFESAMSQMMVAMPDQVMDLFFEYAKDLDRDEIEGIATDSEMAVAFQEVCKVAFPLAESGPRLMASLTQ